VKKLLVIASSLDLRTPLSSTPSWWQLLKALSEAGVELIVTPYQGPAIESPWWTSEANPCQLEGDAVGLLKRLAPARRAPPPPTSAGDSSPLSDSVTRALVERVTKPRWRRHLVRILERQRDIDAVLFLTVPPNHFDGIPRMLEHRFGVPTYFYDGDVPASLPRFAGFRTGFRIYAGADLAEYAAVFSSSAGGLQDLRDLGARQVHTLYYGVDPQLFTRPSVDEDIDVFFYGHGAEYRETWLAAMLGAPSARLRECRFAVRGTRLGNLPYVEQLPYASFNKLREYCCRARVNLLITRQAHTSVFASSTARPFELAALGCAMVSNPYLGIEAWFAPGEEVLVVHTPAEAIDTYCGLLRDPTERQAMGERARQRVLQEHTYAHRAAQFLSALK
jgi:glycosyl transferase family 1